MEEENYHLNFFPKIYPGLFLWKSVSFCHFDIIYWMYLKKKKKNRSRVCVCFFSINHLVKVGVTFFFNVSHIWSETLQKQMPCLLSLLILFRFFSPFKSSRSHFYSWRKRKNAYFLIKFCSVCFSITQHMSDQQHWWAHQTKKCLRLAPPRLNCDLLKNPLPSCLDR